MREIKALSITCNVNKECEWEGTVGSLEEHVATCDFVLCPCPKQCMGDDSIGTRKHLDEHLKNHCPNRDHECPYCGEKGMYANITQDHDMICAKKPLPCPNAGCGDIVQCQEVSEHVSKCPHTVILCKYKGIGCDAELERKDMAAHEQDDKLHLHMALDTFMSQQDAMNQQQVTIDTQQDTIKQQQDAIESLQATTVQQQDFINLIHATTIQQQGTINSTTKQQQSAINLIQATTKQQHGVINSIQASTKQQQGAIKSIQTATKQQQSAIDSLKGNIKFLREFHTVTFALTGYQRRKRRNEKFICPPFYTSPNRYIMAIEVYASGNGSGQGTHVSVFAYILNGPYDAGLKWPFVGNVKVTLLNQLENDHHYTITTDFTPSDNMMAGGNGLGQSEFISNHKLAYDRVKNTQYLKDDTLYFRASVEVADHKTWLQCTI